MRTFNDIFHLDIEDYSECRLTEQGNVFQWDTTKLETEDLETEDLNPSTFCEKPPSYYITKGSEKSGLLSFDAALEFCENIGGTLAVISEENMVESLGLSNVYPTWLGYTDRKKVANILKYFSEYFPKYFRKESG